MTFATARAVQLGARLGGVFGGGGGEVRVAHEPKVRRTSTVVKHRKRRQSIFLFRHDAHPSRGCERTLLLA